MKKIFFILPVTIKNSVMKNQWASLSFLAIILLNSCTKEKLSKEEASNLTEEIPTSILTAGDGAYDVLGWGYDATKEFANANSSGFQVIDIAAFEASNPTRIIEEFPNSQEYKEDYAAEAATYALKISNSVDLTANFKLFGKAVSAGFTSSQTTSGKYDAKYVYGSYNLTIKQRRVRINSDATTLQNYLMSDFVDDVNTYYTSPQILVQRYGTHILLDIYTGAKMEIKFQSETINTNREEAARAGIKAGAKDIFDLNISNSIDVARSSLNYNRKLYYATRGGSAAFGLTGTINLDQTNNQPINFSNWQNSSNRDNAVLVDIAQYGMMFIYDLIADPVKKAAVKTYVDQYLLNNQVYLDYLAVPIYEFYNPAGRDHHYTTSNAPIVGYIGYGEKFKAYSYQVPNTVPFYRYYSYSDKDHYLSQSSSAPYNFVPEGIAFYAFPNQSTGTVPIYEYYSYSDKDHYYTRSTTTPQNFSPFGVKFYAY